MQRRVRVVGVVAALVAGTATVLGPPASASGDEHVGRREPARAEAAPRSPRLAPQTTRTVTLVTGDRVVLHSADGRTVSVDPGEGRDGIRFTRYRVDGHLHIVPSDAAPLVRSGALDRRLFDVTGLVESRYDDAHRDSLPLIVTYESPGARARGEDRLAAAGADPRALPVIDAAAVAVDKESATDFWEKLRGRGRATTLAGGAATVWLDGVRRTVLADSVPQIGAPEAWEAGYTGAGVTVAVLDTGIDATHPDLAGRVGAAKDFTGEGSGDGAGHGTHVASTIAGTGAASDGKYRGVAPDATLLDGKVCDSMGSCPESAIIAGMAWATVEKRADIVNMSFGGTDTPETDPVEEAVTTLTAETGALFVASAGNSGPEAGTVESPGSAEAALTVGAVDKRDQIADFSSRGPRVGDSAVKPDLTAPGVEIVAARAEGTELGTPVGEHYVTASGTSMATPHVAGAAALLAQRRPDWQAQQLKAALMASAQPLPELGAFEQGAGRVDVARAVTQTVTAQPASVSFGLARWPHGDDDPVTKTVTYHNAGEEAVTLDLSVELTGPDGAPAPASAIRLGATTVTVPAGGTADVEVTSDTRHDGPDGEYTGVLVATAGDQVVSTPLAVVREIESYDLTVSFLGRDGQPATDAGGFLYRIDEPVWIDVVPEGTKPVSRRLPKGQYLLHADIAGGSEAHPTATTLVQPVLTLDRDRTVVADARKAKPISTTVERSSVRPVLVDVGYDLFTDEGWLTAGFLAAGFDGVYLGHLGPEVPEATGTLVSHLHSEWAVPGPAQDFAGSPYLYSLLDFAHQRYFTGFERAVRDRDLAKLISRFAEQLPGRAASRTMIPYTNPRIGMWVAELATDPPQTVTSFLDARDVSWAQQFAEYVLDEEGWPETQTYLSGPATSYRAGRSYADQWNAAVFGPAFAEEESYATRLGDEIVVNVMMYSDAAGHWGGSLVDEARTTLFRDGKKVAESEYAGYLEPLIAPATKGSYRLEVSASRPSYSRLSTRVDTAWTFTSAHVEGEDAVALPLSVVRFAPKVDQHNVGTEGRVALVPVAVEPQPGSPAGRTQRLHVEVSMDDGSTWRPAVTVPAGLGRWLVVVKTPANAEYVSLRATATDTKGNTVEQTVVRAYAAGS